MASKPHDEFRDAIIERLNLLPGVTAWANDTGVFLKQLPDGTWVKVKKPFGTKGVPDILGWQEWHVSWPAVPGRKERSVLTIPRTIGIDVKMGNDQLSDAQRVFAKKLKAAGGIFITARCKGKEDFGRMTRFEQQWKEATE